MPIYELNGVGPRFTATGRAYIAPGAQVIGNVVFGRDASVWFNAVVRADNDEIVIGDRTNIQDAAVIHADPGVPAVLGDDVTVGHRAIVHGASVGSGSLIGMGAVLLNRARVGTSSLVGANALITEGKEFPDGALIVGAPAKMIRLLTPEEIAGLRNSAAIYVANAARFMTQLRAIDAASGSNATSPFMMDEDRTH